MLSVDNQSPRVAHIITDLNGFGGTEVALLRYLQGSCIPLDQQLVIVLKSFGTGNTLGAHVLATGVHTLECSQSGSLISLAALRRIRAALDQFCPDVLSAWLYQPSLLASILRLLLRSHPRVVWHIRSLTYSRLLDTPSRYFTQQALRALTWIQCPVVASNSRAAIQEHVRMGFRFPSATIINNGVDSATYAAGLFDSHSVRRALGVPADGMVIGVVARHVPEKGYGYLFSALARLGALLPESSFRKVYLVAAGNGVSADNPAFASLIERKFPFERMRLLGRRSDIPRLLAAMDVFVLPSISEAFPNALLEAMAAGLPCIATDVGQNAEVLGSDEFLVPVGNAERLAAKLADLISWPAPERVSRGEANRAKVKNGYTVECMTREFDRLFMSAALRN